MYVLQPVGCKWSGKSDVIIFLGCIVENDPGNEDRTEQLSEDTDDQCGCETFDRAFSKIVKDETGQ